MIEFLATYLAALAALGTWELGKRAAVRYHIARMLETIREAVGRIRS